MTTKFHPIPTAEIQDHDETEIGTARPLGRETTWTWIHLLFMVYHFFVILIANNVTDASHVDLNQFLGHGFIGSALVGYGIYHMVYADSVPWYKRLRGEGVYIFFGAIGYSIGDFATTDYSTGIPFGKNFGHVAFCVLLIQVSYMYIIVGKHKTSSLQNAPILLSSFAWVLFIFLHTPSKEGNPIEIVGHISSGTWIAMGGWSKLSNRLFETGVCFLLGGYSLLASQTGMMPWAEENCDMLSYFFWWYTIAGVPITFYTHFVATRSVNTAVSNCDAENVSFDSQLVSP